MADRGAGCWEIRLSGSERGWGCNFGKNHGVRVLDVARSTHKDNVLHVKSSTLTPCDRPRATLDNPDATFSDNWPVSSGVAGFEGTNYQYHAGGSAGPGTLGSPIDNLQASFTDSWTPSTGVKQFYAGNYQYHACR